MINVAAILSLKNFPIMAAVGLASISYYIIAALIFFIPSALVAAELASGFPSRGGIYHWVKQAYGTEAGFVAIWLLWTENIIWYPTVLSFTGATIAFLFNPSLAQDPYYLLLVILICYWGCTLFNLKGMKTSGLISTVGVISGTIIPSLFIISLGAYWFFTSKPLALNTMVLFPHLSDLSNIVFLIGVILGFGGIEMSAVHALEVKNPQKNYPKAIFLATAIILILSILATLAISMVVPTNNLSLVAGVMQAFAEFFKAYHLSFLTPIMACLITVGAISMTSTWIVGPSKGILQTAKDGDIPPIFQKMNKNNMPLSILIVQGVIVSLLSLVFLLMPNVSSSYWILTDLTAQLYLLMYLFMFASAIKLRYSQPDVKRAYRVPGGNYLGMWLIAGLGFIGSLFAICIGFIPPTQLKTGSIFIYEAILVIGILSMVILPLTIYYFKKNSWKS
jgi:glutamate:GABA antiporter